MKQASETLLFVFSPIFIKQASTICLTSPIKKIPTPENANKTNYLFFSTIRNKVFHFPLDNEVIFAL